MNRNVLKNELGFQSYDRFCLLAEDGPVAESLHPMISNHPFSRYFQDPKKAMKWLHRNNLHPNYFSQKLRYDLEKMFDVFIYSPHPKTCESVGFYWRIDTQLHYSDLQVNEKLYTYVAEQNIFTDILIWKSGIQSYLWSIFGENCLENPQLKVFENIFPVYVDQKSASEFISRRNLNLGLLRRYAKHFNVKIQYMDDLLNADTSQEKLDELMKQICLYPYYSTHAATMPRIRSYCDLILNPEVLSRLKNLDLNFFA